MARRIQAIKIEAEGRDKGKEFILTEMPCEQGERWALRALLALTNTGAAVPEEALSAGMAGLAAVGIEALGMLQADRVQPLLDELWPSCVQYVHSAKVPPRQPMAGDIEEISTRMRIYRELLKLHTGFSLPVVTPTSESEVAPGEAVKAGWITSMSRALLGLLSRHDSRR